MLGISSFQIGNERIWPKARTARARDIDVIRARLLQRKPHEFAASLVGVTVVQLVSHLSPPMNCPDSGGVSPCSLVYDLDNRISAEVHGNVSTHAAESIIALQRV